MSQTYSRNCPRPPLTYRTALLPLALGYLSTGFDDTWNKQLGNEVDTIETAVCAGSGSGNGNGKGKGKGKGADDKLDDRTEITRARIATVLQVSRHPSCHFAGGG